MMLTIEKAMTLTGKTAVSNADHRDRYTIESVTMHPRLGPQITLRIPNGGTLVYTPECFEQYYRVLQ